MRFTAENAEGSAEKKDERGGSGEKRVPRVGVIRWHKQRDKIEK
jgi:hypothetical protein